MSSDDLLTKEQITAFHAKIDAYLREKDRDVPLRWRPLVLWINVVAAIVAMATRLGPGSTLPHLTLSVAAVLVGGATAAVAAWLSLDGHRLLRSMAIACVAGAVAIGGIGAVASMQRTGPAAPRPLLAPAKVSANGCYVRPTGRVDCTL